MKLSKYLLILNLLLYYLPFQYDFIVVIFESFLQFLLIVNFENNPSFSIITIHSCSNRILFLHHSMYNIIAIIPFVFTWVCLVSKWLACELRIRMSKRRGRWRFKYHFFFNFPLLYLLLTKTYLAITLLFLPM